MVMDSITLAVGAMLLWGVWGILASYALDYGKPGPVVALTYLAGFTVIVISRSEELRSADVSYRFLALSISSGIVMGLGTLFYYRSLEVGSVTIAPTIAGLYFVVTSIYGFSVLGEPITLSKVSGIILACIAIILIAR